MWNTVTGQESRFASWDCETFFEADPMYPRQVYEVLERPTFPYRDDVDIQSEQLFALHLF